MSSSEQIAYRRELHRVAKHLGLPLRGDMEAAIIGHCVQQVDRWVVALGQPQTLTELLELVGTSLGIEFAEIHGPEDMVRLLERIPPSREPSMARLPAELDEQTDAFTLRRTGGEAWERPFLAIINCQGWHLFRRFFSKWHETVHRLLEGQQLQFAFRHTPVVELRREPQEILVDKVAGALAFYPPIFGPMFREVLGGVGHLSFDVVDQTRTLIAPEASRHATLIACLRHCPQPVWFVRCAKGYKRQEQRQLAQGRLPGIGPMPESKLRVQEASGSPAALEAGIRIHRNMQVPDTSLVAQAYRDSWELVSAGREALETWQTSAGGPIGYGTVGIEAVKIDQEVWALVRLGSDVHQHRHQGASTASTAS